MTVLDGAHVTVNTRLPSVSCWSSFGLQPTICSRPSFVQARQPASHGRQRAPAHRFDALDLIAFVRHDVLNSARRVRPWLLDSWGTTTQREQGLCYQHEHQIGASALVMRSSIAGHAPAIDQGHYAGAMLRR